MNIRRGIVLVCVLLLAAIIVSCSDEQAGESCGVPLSDQVVDSLLNQSRKYPVKSGIITYKLEGLNNGMRRLYFDDYGMKTVTVSDTNFRIGVDDWADPVIELNWKHYELTRGMFTYQMRIPDGKATKGLGMEGFLVQELGRAFTPEDWANFNNGFMRQEKTGTDTLLGRTCEVWYYPDSKATSWRWNGIKVALQEHGSDQPDMVAVEIRENPEIPDRMFVVPEGLEFEYTPAEG